MSHRTNWLVLSVFTALGIVAADSGAQQRVHKIGYVGDLSGPMQDNYAPLAEAFEYYVKELNERGGIDGVPVRLAIRNDQLDATRAASLTLELATAENVNSIWGMSQSRTHMAVYQAAQRNRVPAVSMFSGIKEILPPKPLPYAYSIGHVFEVAGEVSGKLAAQAQKGQGRAVCASIEAPGGVAVCQFTEGAAQAGGLQTGTVLFPPTVTEFGAIAQRMLGMQPTIVVAHAGSGQNVGLIRGLRGAGYNGPILMGSHGLNETPLIQAVQGVGGLASLQLLSRFASPDSEGKELDELRAAARKHSKKDPISTTSIMGWTMGKVMEASLRKCGYPCSGDQLNATLENLTVDVGALMGGPIQFKPDDHYGKTWWRVYQYNETARKFQPVSSWLETSSTPTLRKQ